jgi:peptide subunit release factor 1 (eRF1)
LRPLTAIADVLPRVGIVLADKTKARLYDYWMDELREREHMEWELPRHGRSDGFVGYDAGHAQRHVEHETMHHYKQLADRIMELQQTKQWDKVLIGCRNDNWPEIEPHLHPYTRQAFVGRFHVDPAAISPDELKKVAEEQMREFRFVRAKGLLGEVIGQSQRDGRGVTGLKRVLESMERGEIQTLLIGRNFKSKASECPNCGHLDAHAPALCAVCGTPNGQLDDVADLLLSFAVRNGIEIVHVNDDPTFDRIGNVAALLRFRADQNTNVAMERAG